MRERLCTVGMSAFDSRTMSHGEVDEHVMASEVLFVVYNASGAAVGFAGLQREVTGTRKYIHLSGAALLEEAQGDGVYKKLVHARVMVGLTEGATLIETSTQNPKVEVGIREALAELFMQGKIDGCAMTRKHSPKHYGRMLTSTVPTSRCAEVNKEYGKLDYGAGDCYQLAFEIGG